MQSEEIRGKIRDAQVEDAPVLASAEREIVKTPGRLASLPHELKDHEFELKITSLNQSDTGKYIVIEAHGQIVGHAFLEPFQLEATAHAVNLTMAVHEGFQGRGYGKALLNHLVGWAKGNPKVEKIMLHVRSSNMNAIALYKKTGFLVEGVRVKQIKIGPNSYLDNIAMALWVGP